MQSTSNATHFLPLWADHLLPDCMAASSVALRFGAASWFLVLQDTLFQMEKCWGSFAWQKTSKEVQSWWTSSIWNETEGVNKSSQ